MWGGMSDIGLIVGPTSRSKLIGPIGPEDGPSAMGVVGTTSKLQDHGAIDQAVEKRGR
jgi:hypothetical protein